MLLICLAIQCGTLFKRLTSGLLFHQSVFHATIAYEVLHFWLFLIVAIHAISGKPFSLTALFFCFLSGVFFAAIASYNMLFIINKRLSSEDNPIKYFESEIQFLTYFHKFSRIVEHNGLLKNYALLHGILQTHLENCKYEGCECREIAEYFDLVAKRKRIF